MTAAPDYIDSDGQGWWHLALVNVRSDPTGHGPWRRVHIVGDELEDMSPADARQLGTALIAAANFAESGGPTVAGRTNDVTASPELLAERIAREVESDAGLTQYDGGLYACDVAAFIARAPHWSQIQDQEVPTVADHEVILEFDGYYVPSPRMVCNAPADGLCHAVWSCDCEAFYDGGLRNGVPAHRPDHYDPDTWHSGVLDPSTCNLRDWYEESDEVLHGLITVPVEAEWECDFYRFTLAPEPRDSEHD